MSRNTIGLLVGAVVLLVAMALTAFVTVKLAAPNNNNNNGANVEVVDNDSKVTAEMVAVKREYDKLSEEKQEVFFMLIAGTAEYFDRVDQVNDANGYLAVLGRTQSALSWNARENPALSEAFAAYLVSEGFGDLAEGKMDNVKLDTTNKNKLAGIHRKLAGVLE